MTKNDFDADHNNQKLIFFVLVVAILIFPIVWILFYFIDSYFTLIHISLGIAVIIAVLRIFIKKINVGSNLYGLIIPIILYINGKEIYIAYQNYAQIQQQAKYISNNQINMHIAIEKKVNYDIEKYNIMVKDIILVDDIEKKEKYRFFLNKQEQHKFKTLLISIKKIENYRTNQTPSCGMIISLATDSNYLGFAKNVLGIELENESDQKAIADLLNFITVNTNGLVDFNASCPN